MSPPRLRPAPAVVAAVLAALVLVLGAAPLAASEPEWNIARIGAPASAPGVVIAVVDTGIDDRHPVFAGRVLPAIDLVGGRGGDPNGHGTHVAGTAAGADAGCGSIGVAPDARLLPVRVLDEDGEGTVDGVAEGIRRAADAGADIINLSLGTDVVLRSVSGTGLEDSIRYAWAKGSIPVLAAGNDGVFGGLLGSGYGGIPAVVVTATDHRDRVAPYATSIGSAEWGVAAPGGDTSGEEGRDILSAFPGDRCALHAGTSMAAPHVSGALAALRSRGLAPRAAIDHLLETARDLGPSGPDGTYGHGLIDIGAALRTLPDTPVTTVAATPDPVPTPSAGTSPSTTEPVDPPVTTTPPRTSDPDPTPASSTPTTAGDGPDGTTTSTQLPRAPAPQTSGSSGSDPEDASRPVVVNDEDGDDDRGVPVGLVAAAAVAVLGTGLAAGTALRAQRRRL